MNSNQDAGNVVDLQQRQAQQLAVQSTDKNLDTLKSIRVLAVKRHAGLVSSMFDGVDDALFDMAEKAENNSVQTKFFDGMREVRKKRPEMERAVTENLNRTFQEFLNAARRADRGGEKHDRPEGGLTLIDEGELEESLAMSSMIGKTENRTARQLFSLNQRLSAMIGGGKCADEDNPFGPKALIKAFQQTLMSLEGDVQTIKLIILKLYDKHVASALDAMYEELNAQLVDSGVLPQLKHSVLPKRPVNAGGAAGGVAGAGQAGPAGAEQQQQPAAMGGSPGMQSGPGGMMPMGGGYASNQGYTSNQGYAGNQGYGENQQQVAYGSGADAALQAEVFNSLRSLLAARHSGYSQGMMPVGMPMPIAPQNHQGPSLNATELLGALSILQNQVTPMQAGFLPSFGNFQPNLQAVQRVKDELLHQAERLSGTDHKVTAADEDTIDLVGMLFEFILQDKNLPAEIQAQLARLQIPYLKVAILDKHLFARKEHPARKLLDEMAHASVGWSEESDKERRLIEKIREIVESILKDFDEDTHIFTRKLEEFIDFHLNLKKRADVAEQRTTETARGREKLQAARKNAAKEILIRMEAKAVPEVIRHILTRPWANVLVLTSLRQGEGSHQWNSLLRVVDELIWSSQGKANDDERKRLRALVPELEKALRQGLSLVAYQESDVAHLLGELHKLYAVLLDPKTNELIEIDANTNDTVSFDNDFAESSPEPVEKPTIALIIEEKAKFTPPPASVNDETNFVDEIVLGSRGEEDTEEEAIDDEFVDLARSLRVGTWVEFKDVNGHSERAKLSWISPISAKYLFVNRKGLKVGDKTVWGLAADLRAERAEVLEDVPLFDRALDAIVERLKAAPSLPDPIVRETGEPDPREAPVDFTQTLG
jgi:Protein of unknown function (DUF1631)